MQFVSIIICGLMLATSVVAQSRTGETIPQGFTEAEWNGFTDAQRRRITERGYTPDDVEAERAESLIAHERELRTIPDGMPIALAICMAGGARDLMLDLEETFSARESLHRHIFVQHPIDSCLAVLEAAADFTLDPESDPSRDLIAQNPYYTTHYLEAYETHLRRLNTSPRIYESEYNMERFSTILREAATNVESNQGLSFSIQFDPEEFDWADHNVSGQPWTGPERGFRPEALPPIPMTTALAFVRGHQHFSEHIAQNPDFVHTDFAREVRAVSDDDMAIFRRQGELCLLPTRAIEALRAEGQRQGITQVPNDLSIDYCSFLGDIFAIRHMTPERLSAVRQQGG